VDYFFVSKDEFAHMIEQEELIEYAIVYNDYKGIPKQQVREALASGRDVVMRVDVQGAATVRKSETAENLSLRIATARQELKRAAEFDYVVVNADGHLQDTVDTVVAIIQAEHHRVNPRMVSL
jgi:guanylate kinase